MEVNYLTYNKFEKMLEIKYGFKKSRKFIENKINLKMNLFSKKWKGLSLTGSENLNNQGIYHNIIKLDLKKIHIKKPLYMDYDLYNKKYDGITLFVDRNIRDYDKIKSKYKCIFLAECKKIAHKIYKYVKHNLDKYDLIFTHDYELYKKNPNKIVLLPGSTTILDYSQWKIYNKSKLISWATGNMKEHSSKKGYEKRFNLHKLLEKNNYQIKNKKIDLFGFSVNKPFIDKIILLKKYMFCIVIENCKYDYYFTEKLLDCLLTGTIPIYWGCPSIGNIFNSEAILSFNTLDDLKKIINNISEEFYYSKIKIIKQNFNKAKKITLVDDILFFSAYKHFYLNKNIK